MADFAAQAPPTSVTKSPAPSVGADSPYHSIVQDAQSGLMEKVQADVGHVVHALEAIWNEVGYSGEERRLQMDKLSDELTQTLRAKLAQEVEVRDVFKKDIQAKIAECEMLARSVDDDGTAYWQARNSWGTQWGEYGFFKAKRSVTRARKCGTSGCTLRDGHGGLCSSVPPVSTDAHGRERRAPEREATERIWGNATWRIAVHFRTHWFSTHSVCARARAHIPSASRTSASGSARRCATSRCPRCARSPRARARAARGRARRSRQAAPRSTARRARRGACTPTCRTCARA